MCKKTIMGHSLRLRPFVGFLNCFTLQQGTILIAIVHLFAAGIAVTFCILALTHAVDIREMVARDAEDAMDRGYFEDDNSMRINIKRMKIAGDNAIGRVEWMWYYLILWGNHLLCTIFMLYGVLTFRRRCILPWLLLNALEVVYFLLCLVTECHPFTVTSCTIFALETIGVLMHFHCAYTVWSAYISVDWKKGLIVHEVHDLKKELSSQSIAEHSTLSPRLLTKPYEV